METNKPLEIIVLNENTKEFIDIYTSIRSLTDNDVDVPWFLIKRFLELMYNPGKYKLDQLFKKAQEFSAIAVQWIISNNDYHFNWNDTVYSDNRAFIKNDIAKIFLELIYAFLLFKEDNVNADKNDAVTFFYQAFDDGYRLRMDANSRKDFSPYKQAVVSGVLAMSMGFHLSSIKNLTNEEIFQATRYAIKKYLKEV